MPQDPITLQAGIRARTYADMVREIIDRAKQAATPAGMTMQDALANIGDVAGFGHRAEMGLVNTGTQDRPLWQPKPGSDFDPSGSALGGSTPVKTSEMLAGPVTGMTARKIVGGLKPMPPATPAGTTGTGEGEQAMSVGRRGFLKAVPGGAMALKALLEGGTRGVEEQVGPRMMEGAGQAAAQTAPAVAGELGAAPIRVYERVGNKFILTHEVPNEGLPPITNVGTPHGESNRLMSGKLVTGYGKPESQVIVDRPLGGLRPVDTSIEHPEHQMLAEPRRVLQSVTDPNFVGESPEMHQGSHLAVTNDPYHARMLQSQKHVEDRINDINLANATEARPDQTKGWTTAPALKDMTPEQVEAWKGVFGKDPADGGVVTGMNIGPHQPNSYIIEKPVRVRYYEKAFTDESATSQHSDYPEIFKLPIEYKGELDHFNLAGEGPGTIDRGYSPWERAPRLVGSGDTYDEAISKAHSFLHDIGIDPKTLKMTGGDKIKRIELPNGDMIEIRERPSLRPGYSPKKAGYKGRGEEEQK